jgi:PPP family 3-phenylpropionic acid transporter
LTTGAYVSCLYGALFIILGVQVTYLPVWLDGRGLSAPEISLAMSASLLLRIVVTPTVAFLADRSGNHQGAIVGLGWAALIMLLCLSQAQGFWPIFVLVAAALIAVASIIPLADTIAMSAERKVGIGYGRMRLWGSLAFIAASFGAGLAVESQGAEAVIWLLVFGTAATLVAAHLLSGRHQNGAHVRPRLTLSEVAALGRQSRFALFIVTSGAIQASHAVFYLFGVLHWRAQGFSALAIGVLWAIGVLAEIALFWVSRALASRIGPVELMLLGGGAAILRWILTGLDPPFTALLALQLLHALTYAASHLGAMHWIAIGVPEQQQGTAQALLNTFTAGIAMSGAMLCAGALYGTFGGATYMSMAALAAAGVLAGLILRARPPRDAARIGS